MANTPQPTGLGQSANIVKSMAYNPIHQTDMKNYLDAERADNRAISMRDRATGKAVAAEQSRQIELKRIGNEMKTRKDRLAFAKKMDDKNYKLREEGFKFQKKQADMEWNLGLASTVIGTFNMFHNLNSDRLWSNKMDTMLEATRKATGVKSPQQSHTHGVVRRAVDPFWSFIKSPYTWSRNMIKDLREDD